MILRSSYLFRRMLVVLLAVGTLAGCDSAGDDPSDAEMILGAWTAVRLQDGEGDRTNELAAAGSLEIQFDDGAFTLMFDPVGSAAGTTMEGTYTLQQEIKSLQLRAALPGLPGQQITLPLTYGLRGDDELDLRVSETFTIVLEAVLGAEAPDFTGDVELTFERD